jgi:hypothetical protein
MKNETKSNIKSVSGPINLVRLQGSINGVQKIVYLFMDYHMDVEYQTFCSDIKAPSLRQFLMDNFEKSKIHLDFFIEIFPSKIMASHSQILSKYIWDIQELVKRSFNIEGKR